jgi:hypothetical protein
MAAAAPIDARTHGYYYYAAEQGREGSGREKVKTAREGKGLPTIPFLPSRVGLII